MIGPTLGHYRILAKLGAGGMGEVYAAEDTILKRRVAIKLLPSTLIAQPARRGRLEREAQAVAALNHPGIVTIHSVELSGETPFLTMELVEGTLLSASIGRDGIPFPKLLPIAIALADAIAAAHQRGVVHRDLKPANVMLTDDGRVKVLDFGLAKLKDYPGPAPQGSTTTRSVTEEGTLVGTVAYMSPEQADGSEVDARSDIFSFGVLLYELAVGERPFCGNTNILVLTSILRDTPPPVTERNAALPRDLDRIVRRCLAKDPRARYQSAADLRNDLEDVKREADSGGLVAAGMAMPARHARTGAHAVLVAGAAAVIVSAAIGYQVWSRTRTPPATASVTSVLPADNLRRIVVTVFENRTGDPSLDSLGRLIGERVIQELTEAQIGEPAPSPVTTVEAPALHAGVMIGGTFDQDGDALSFQTRVTRGSDGKVLYAPDPVSIPKTAGISAFASLHQNLMGFLAMYTNGWDPTPLSKVPLLAAVREHATGVQLLGRDAPRSLRHLQRALEIDPEFVPPRLFVIATLQMARQWEESEKALLPLVASRQRLSRYEQAWADRLVAEQEGRHADALAAILDAESVAPQEFFVNYSVGVTQLRLNRPAAALATFARVPVPDWVARTGAYGARLGVALDARHMLGDFVQERLDASDAQRTEPRSAIARSAEARALLGLGKLAEALQVVDSLQAIPEATGPALVSAVRELRAHGNLEQSITLARRVVERLRNLPSATAATETAQTELVRALYAAERWNESQEVAQALARKAPDRPEYLGLLGVIAARRGDRPKASASSESLRRLSQPYLFGSHTLWRARIAALLGDETAAIEMLRDAFSQGVVFSVEMHRDMDLEPLRSNTEFRELMRPKN